MCPTYVINFLDLSGVTKWQVDDLICTMIGPDSDICTSLANRELDLKLIRKTYPLLQELEGENNHPAVCSNDLADHLGFVPSTSLIYSWNVYGASRYISSQLTNC